MRGSNFTITESTVGGTPQVQTPDQDVKFRLLDDDGNVYFVGYMKTDFSEDTIFIPLDEFGEAYGCVSIEIFSKIKKSWVVV